MKTLCFALAAIFAVNGSSSQSALAIPRQIGESDFQQAIATPVKEDSTLRYDDLLNAIRRHNPSIRAARIGAQSMAQDERHATALPDPVVIVSYQPFPVLTARGSQRSQVRVEQGFPYPGKRGLRGDIARLTAEAAESEIDAKLLDLLYQARAAWLELQHIERVKRHIDTFEMHLRDYEDVAAQQYSVGTGMQQPILKAQLERTTLARLRLELASRESAARQSLRRITGLSAVEISGSGAQQRHQLPAIEASEFVAVARSRRPEFESLQLLERTAEASVELAKRDYLPDFGVSLTWFDITSEDAPPSANGRDALAIGVSVRVPLWRGPRSAAVEKQLLRRKQVDARRETLELELETQIADLVMRLRADAEQITLYEQALLPQAESTIEATLSAYSTARTDFLTLLDAERMLFTLNSEYEEARTRYASSTIRLERVTGVTRLDQYNK